jgi:HAD superfamily hydrolase (TIGR01549 family)
VLLDSNKVKTEAFRELFAEFGPEAAQTFCDYHVSHTGISRFVKVKYFFESIVEGAAADDTVIKKYIDRYGEIVFHRLVQVPLVPGVVEFLETHQAVPKFIVSGGLESELKDVFHKRSLSHYFKLICGSPRSKDEILRDLGKSLPNPTLFFGDSAYDYKMAQEFGHDFIFVKGFTEMSDCQNFLQKNHILSISDFRDPGLQALL